MRASFAYVASVFGLRSPVGRVRRILMPRANTRGRAFHLWIYEKINYVQVTAWKQGQRHLWCTRALFCFAPLQLPVWTRQHIWNAFEKWTITAHIYAHRSIFSFCLFWTENGVKNTQTCCTARVNVPSRVELAALCLAADWLTPASSAAPLVWDVHMTTWGRGAKPQMCKIKEGKKERKWGCIGQQGNDGL